jgi:hypothetical protein
MRAKPLLEGHENTTSLMSQHHTHDPDKPTILGHAIRAGELVQMLFYTFLENTWAYDLSSVRVVRNEDRQILRIEVIDGVGVAEGPRGASSCERYADGWLFRFPDKCVGPRDRDAVRCLLADHSSTWALVCMHAAVQVLFEGRYTALPLDICLTCLTDLVDDVNEDIKELVHYTGNHVRRIVNYKGPSGSASKRNDRLYPDMDAKGKLKAVYDITLKDGTRIVVDPASAQWRFRNRSTPNQPAMRWTEYWQAWGGALKYRVPFRTHASRHAENLSAYRIVTHHTVTMEQAFYFNTFILRLKKTRPDELQYVYNMDTEQFNEFKAQVLGQARDYIQRRPRELDGEASPSSPGSNANNHDSDAGNSDQVVLEYLQLPLSLPLDIKAISGFDWGLFRRIIQLPHKDITYREKKRARTLLSHRCVYKMPGDWRLVFLQHILPDLRVPDHCVNENPFWR